MPKVEDVVRNVTTSNMSGHCFDPMQQLTAYMRGQYTLYDELFFGEVNVEMTTRSFARG